MYGPDLVSRTRRQNELGLVKLGLGIFAHDVNKRSGRLSEALKLDYDCCVFHFHSISFQYVGRA